MREDLVVIAITIIIITQKCCGNKATLLHNSMIRIIKSEVFALKKWKPAFYIICNRKMAKKIWSE